MTTAAPHRTAARSPKILFRILAVAEAITWSLLITGMLIAYVFDGGRWGISIGGALHGFVFLAFLAGAVLVAVNQRWHVGVVLLVFASAIVPLATIPVDIWLDRSGRLDGHWRTEATDDPRDRRPIDRLVRWALRHPVLLGVVAAVAVVALFAGLLLGGPPGGE